MDANFFLNMFLYQAPVRINYRRENLEVFDQSHSSEFSIPVTEKKKKKKNKKHRRNEQIWMIYFQVKVYLISIVPHLLQKMQRSGLFVPSGRSTVYSKAMWW